MSLHDFAEFIRTLNQRRVRYLVIGGYAVAFHGHPRATDDVDILIASDEEKVGPELAEVDPRLPRHPPFSCWRRVPLKLGPMRDPPENLLALPHAPARLSAHGARRLRWPAPRR